jgi:hypothetical protein
MGGRLIPIAAAPTGNSSAADRAASRHLLVSAGSEPQFPYNGSVPWVGLGSRGPCSSYMRLADIPQGKPCLTRTKGGPRSRPVGGSSERNQPGGHSCGIVLRVGSNRSCWQRRNDAFQACLNGQARGAMSRHSVESQPLKSTFRHLCITVPECSIPVVEAETIDFTSTLA